MRFNGKSIVLVGLILFILQIVNFISLDFITPSSERAQVLAAISSIIIILIGLLFNRINPASGLKAELKGDIKFIYDKNLPKDISEELAWGSEAILTATGAASILINKEGKNILRRGIFTDKDFLPGETCKRALKEMKLISLVNLEFYPGRDEFNEFCPNIPSILIIPINKNSFILIGGWSTRCFTKSDEKWISKWSNKLKNMFDNLELN